MSFLLSFLFKLRTNSNLRKSVVPIFVSFPALGSNNNILDHKNFESYIQNY